MDPKLIKINSTKYELDKKKKIYNAVNLNKLPDKGARIKHQIEELENVLKSLSLDTPASNDENNVPNSPKRESNVPKASVDNINDFKDNPVSEISIKGDAKVSDLQNNNAYKTNVGKSTVSNISLKVDETATFAVKSCTSQTLSFSDLAKGVGKTEIHKHYADSPSFTNYRDIGNLRKTQLTDAKPLIEQQNSKIVSNRNFNSVFHPKTDEECVKKLHHSLVTYPENSNEESDPEHLKSELMIHQRKGLAWLVWREQQDPSGGILADDMGLGKTITIISLILKQKEKENYFAFNEEKFECKGTLVVCLASIIHQWKEEILKHSEKDALKVLVYHGPKREKHPKIVMKSDVILTTYNILMTEKKALDNGNESPLFKLKWERIVLDEAHTIKNHKSQTAQAVFCLKAFRKWAITGTPIHNDFKDMYSLLKFLEFAPFDDYKKFKKLIDDDSESSAQRRNLLVKSILLRRTKGEVDEEGNRLIEMKNKTFSLCYIKLSDEERKIYDKLNESISKKVNQYLLKPSKLNSSSNLLVLLLRLQQCCNHVSLLKNEVEEYETDISSDITKNMSCLVIDKDASNTNSSDSLTLDEFEVNSLISSEIKSSKITVLFEKLKKVSEVSQNTDKSVIVSQWVSMLNIIAYHLKLENIKYHMIIGNTKVEDRQKSAEDFNKNKDGAKVMLLSLKAGGVGLNLVGANHLFLLDLHWNPALEMQACDRIHRVGQEKDVSIHKFVCTNTIEERILLLQNNKRSVASSVLHAKKQSTKGLTMEDFRILFNAK